MWTVLKNINKTYALCRCSCGVERTVCLHSIAKGMSRSCGCSRGKYFKRFKKERRCWALLRHRCNCTTSSDYSRYGGRGITVCERWNNFENFFDDMGEAPGSDMTIERIDVNGNYEPSNCRWASFSEQAQNKTNTRWVVVNGQKMSLSMAARALGLGDSTLRERLKRGWSESAAMTTPVEHKYASRKRQIRS